jgi:hypothetical protein
LEKSAEDLNMGLQVGKICRGFEHGGPSWKRSAEDLNMGPQVEKIRGRFEHEVPSWRDPRKI